MRFIVILFVLAMPAWSLDRHPFNKAMVDGNYVEAEAMAKRWLREAEAQGGPDCPDALQALDLLVEVAVAGEHFNDPAVDGYAKRVIETRERVNGPDSEELAQSLHFYGNVLTQRAEYEKSRPVHERAIAIYEKHLQPESRATASSFSLVLDDFSILLVKMGEYRTARDVLLRSLAIREHLSGTNTLAFALILTSIGDVERLLGNPAAGITQYERALPIITQRFGRDHSQTVEAEMGLGSVLLEVGDKERARELLEHVLAVREKLDGPNHPEIAEVVQNLARVYEASGEMEKAGIFFRRAIEINRLTFGPDHPEVAVSESRYAALLAKQGQGSEARKMASSAERIGREHLSLQLRTLPQTQALAYAASRPSGLGTLLTLAAAPDDSRAAEIAFDALIRSRALVFDELAARRRSMSPSGVDSQALAAARERLSQVVLRGPGRDPVDAYTATVRDARNQVDRLERSLAEGSAEFREEFSMRHAGIDEVRAAIPEGSVLVSYALSDGSLIAFVTGKGQVLQAVQLGRVDQVDADIACLRRRIDEEAASMGHGSKRSEAAYRADAARLRQRIWDPLEPLLGDARNVLIVRDGALHQVNFAALPAREGPGYLIDGRRVFHYLSTERDLLSRAGKQGQDLLALGNPAFTQKPPVTGTVASAAVFRGAQPGCEDFASMRFPALPGSAREVHDIAALWGGRVVRLEGDGADEIAFKLNAPGKRILHIAAHGFFLGSECGVGESPLLLSGLALAGANERQGKAGDDGILTAEEIASLNLEGVEWAVLSACDTGAGKFQAGEGILGLERAFQVAGVRTVIMSLWGVEDEATRQWMSALYEARFRKRATTAEALRSADLAVLARRRGANQSTHPFYWAGFVATGDWR